MSTMSDRHAEQGEHDPYPDGENTDPSPWRFAGGYVVHPDLLAACKHTLNLLADIRAAYDGQDEIPGWMLDLVKQYQETKAAIAKAEGRPA